MLRKVTVYLLKGKPLSITSILIIFESIPKILLLKTVSTILQLISRKTIIITATVTVTVTSAVISIRMNS